MHGLFSAQPTFSTRYAGTHNQSALFGYTGDAPDVNLVFNSSGLSDFDYRNSYISAWVYLESGFGKCFKIFEKGEVDLCFKVETQNGAHRLLANVSGVECDSGIDIPETEWVNVGLHISKQSSTVGFFKKELGEEHHSWYQKSGHSSYEDVNNDTSVYVGLSKYGSYANDDLSGHRAWMDNLRVDVGFFDGESDFAQIADVDNEVTIPEIHKDQWAHVGATYDPNSACVKLYHNGNIVGKYTNYTVNMTDPDNADVCVGKLGSGEMAGGVVVSEVNIYDRVLTDNQMYSIATQ